MIGEVEKDPWDLAFKIVTKRLVTRRKTPGLDDPDRVKYIMRSLFPYGESFQRQDRSSCVVWREELFTFEELKRASGKLKANTAPGIDGVPNEILKEVIGAYLEILLEAFNSCLQRLQGHMVDENGLSEKQFGFWKDRSTADAIQAVVDIATKARRGTGKRMV